MKKFRFEGFQQDAFGGAFPLFTEVIETSEYSAELLQSWTNTEYGTTLGGRSLFEMGYIIPAFPILQDTPKGEVFEFEQRETIDIPSKDKILDS